MKVLLYTQSNILLNEFINSLISKGIELLRADILERSVELIADKKIDVFVIDISQENFNKIINIVKSIKDSNLEEIKKTAVILYGVIESERINEALAVGVNGFLKWNDDFENYVANYILGVYERIKGTPPERKFTRITLDYNKPEERFIVKFRSPYTSNLILGVVKDISFGGVAVELIGSFPREAILKNMEVKNMHLVINKQDVYADAVVVLFQGNLCAFRFTYLAHQDREIIGRFIFEKMSKQAMGGSIK